MRVHLCRHQIAGQFSKQLLAVGDGTFLIHSSTDVIQLPNMIGTLYSVWMNWCVEFTLICRSTLAILLGFLNDAFLSTLKKTTLDINIYEALPGDCVEYKSIDTVPDETEAINFPMEFLNSLDVSGLPPHLLSLKIGVPILIFRSLDPPRVTNGTRCLIAKLSANTIEV